MATNHGSQNMKVPIEAALARVLLNWITQFEPEFQSILILKFREHFTITVSRNLPGLDQQIVNVIKTKIRNTKSANISEVRLSSELKRAYECISQLADTRSRDAANLLLQAAKDEK